MSIRRIRFSHILRSRAGGVRRAKHLTICLVLLGVVLSASLVFSLSSDQEEAIALLYETVQLVDDNYARTPDFKKMYVAGLEGLKKGTSDGRFDFEEKAGGEVLLKARDKELLIRLGGDTEGGLGAFERAYRFVVENAEDSDKKKKGGLRVMYAALSSMLRSLDPFSTFVSPDAYRQMRVEHTGRYGGVGVIITVRDKKLTVISPIEDTPAYRAGLKSEDVILEIDGVATGEMPSGRCRAPHARTRGQVGGFVDFARELAQAPQREVAPRHYPHSQREDGGEGRRNRLSADHGLSWPHDAGAR